MSKYSETRVANDKLVTCEEYRFAKYCKYKMNNVSTIARIGSGLVFSSFVFVKGRVERLKIKLLKIQALHRYNLSIRLMYNNSANRRG